MTKCIFSLVDRTIRTACQLPSKREGVIKTTNVLRAYFGMFHNLTVLRAHAKYYYF